MFTDRRVLKELQELRKEIKPIMPSIAEVKAAVAAKAEEVKVAVVDAVTKETTEVKAQIQTLKDQIGLGTPITQADLDELLGSVAGIAPAATSAIDAISTGDGA